MKRILSTTILLIGVIMLLYSIYIVSIGKFFVEPASIIFTSASLLFIIFGSLLLARKTRMEKRPMKFACLVFRHQWEGSYGGNPPDPETHTCHRCGITQTHKWERVEDKCEEVCIKCGKRKQLPHSFIEEFPCHFVCQVCGKREENHRYTHKSSCERVCTKCGEILISHQWHELENEIHFRAEYKSTDWNPTAFWLVWNKENVYADKLPDRIPGCYCEQCLEVNPHGYHVCQSDWVEETEGQHFYITKCMVCGTVIKKISEEEKNIKDEEAAQRRYERLVNEDEGIV